MLEDDVLLAMQVCTNAVVGLPLVHAGQERHKHRHVSSMYL